MDFDRIARLLRQRQFRHTLPQPFYTEREILDFDLTAIFNESWLMAGFEAELPEPGSTMTFQIGRNSVILVRGEDDAIRGFHNTCRHRGGEILPEGCRKVRRLTCPYHQWSYGLDGALLNAPRMPAAFDKAGHGLGPVAVETVGGTVYVCLSENPPPFDAFRADLEPLLAAHDFRNAKVAVTRHVVEKANWKLVMENARECYHCAGQHPDLRASFPVLYTGVFGMDEKLASASFKARMAAAGLVVGPNDGEWWQGVRFQLNEGCVSISPDGKAVSQPPLCSIYGGDVGSLRWALEPNNFCHATGDYVLYFSAMPTGPEETLVTLKFLVHKDAQEGIDYDPARLIETWNKTNDQDRDLAEAGQRGVNSLGYKPGPYSEDAEPNVDIFVTWYCDKAWRYLEARNSGISRVDLVAAS